MKNYLAYKIWLGISAALVLVAVVATITYTAPTDCTTTCDMAHLDLIPLYLLAFAALIGNVIVIPGQLIRNRHEFTPVLVVSSWLLLILSTIVVAVGFIYLML